MLEWCAFTSSYYTRIEHICNIYALYMQSWKKCVFPVITTMALWQLMHLGVTVHNVPNCMSCHKTIVMITGRSYYFHDCIYITLILLLWDWNILCEVDHLWPIHIFVLYILYIYIVWIKITTFFNHTMIFVKLID